MIKGRKIDLKIDKNYQKSSFKDPLEIGFKQ